MRPDRADRYTSYQPLETNTVATFNLKSLQGLVLCAAVLAAGSAQATVPHTHKHRHPQPAAGVRMATRAARGHRAAVIEIDPLEVARENASTEEPHLRSSDFLVLDAENSDVLLSQNADRANPIASITKLMTALVVLEAKQPLDEEIEITENDEHLERPFNSYLKRGTRLTREELLHLALMASENRAAHALARSYPGGLFACITAMNLKALELGMSSTKYVEPTGLSEFNVASPEDLSKLVLAASAVPMIKEFSTDSKFAVPIGRHLVEFHTTDKLVTKADWDIVLQKTGYITEAGRCLVMKTIIEGRAIVIVLMNSAGGGQRLVDAQKIKSWLDAKAAKIARF